MNYESNIAVPKQSEEWHGLSVKGLQGAYTEDEEEYSLELIKKTNPEYESG